MTFGQLRIEGDEIVFFEYPGLGRFGEVRRRLRPVVLDTVTEQEFDWLSRNAKGKIPVVHGEAKISDHDYELVRNQQTGQVAVMPKSMIITNPMDTLSARFYDGITYEIARLEQLLEKHRGSQAISHRTSAESRLYETRDWYRVI